MSTWQRLTTVLALSVAGMMLFPATSIGDTFTIRMAGSFGSFHYQPDERHILKNDRIRFKNPDGQPSHTVTAYGGNWSYNKTLQPGERVIKRFRRRGTFKFRCTFHSSLNNGVCTGMCGKVRVHRP